MSPKNKKTKKKEGKVRNENEEKTQKCCDDFKQCIKQNENLSNYFKNEEIVELKNTVKTKNLFEIPLITGAAILNKLELLKNFLKQGYNINETGANHTTALVWSVKCKNREIIELLLNRGADPTIKSENGDHVLLIALESKLWDEESFINLWNNVKNVTFIDVDYKNKCGHSMLHVAVRREWKDFINILIAEKANMNITNINGITPLMLACFRNNETLVKQLLQSGASSLKEDDRGCISLCYAISSTVLRNEKPPFAVVNIITTDIKKHGVSLKDYLKKRVDINNPITKSDMSAQATADMLVHIVAFATLYLPDGLKILLELNIFQEIRNALNKFYDDLKYLTTILTILNELIFYTDYYMTYSHAIERNLIKSFFVNGTAKTCLQILKTYNYSEQNHLFSLTIYPLIAACSSNSFGQEWLQNNYLDLIPFYENFIEDSMFTALHRDENHVKMIQYKTRRFKELMCKLKRDDKNMNDIEPHDGEEENEILEELKQESKLSTKKTRRRSKALKAKIAKIKSADLAERLNLNGKKLNEQKSNTSISQNENEQPSEVNSEIVLEEHILQSNASRELLAKPNPPEETEIVRNIKNMLVELQKHSQEEENIEPLKRVENKREWKNIVPRLIDKCVDNVHPKDIDVNPKVSSKIGTNTLQETLIYLSELLQKIIVEYQKHWKNDKEFRYQIVRRGQGDSSSKQNETEECWKSNLEDLEKEYIENLENDFNKLIACIKEQAPKNHEICQIAINKLENILIDHEIRGKTLMLVNDCTTIPVKSNRNAKTTLEDGEFFMMNYFEEAKPLDNLKFNIDLTVIGNDNYFTTYRDETPDTLYYKEMAALPKLKKKLDYDKVIEARNKTMENAYHLIPSIMAICESDDECDIFDETSQSEDNMIDLNPNNSNSSTDILTPKSKSEYSNIILKALTKHVENNAISGNVTSRWCELICSLQNLMNQRVLFGSELRISCVEKRYNYVISTGGNFNPVELGLDINNRPLAFKRIPKETTVCKTLKSLLNPLMGIRNSHILHYFLCDYDGNDLIFATPLCEYNIGQYVMLLKQTTYVHLTASDVVRQFLSGLMYLHTQKEPIVHGNLKPSNIFVDINGTVRVAEFGIHKALFKLNEAPDSSIIWFAPETYKTFRQSLAMECTCASDIQVAGMLVHFILSGGKHPYGDDTKDILKNLDKATPQLIVHDVDLQDLITWMLLYEPNERPVIKQVLTHVYFWTSERKWRFVLSCAGISTHGSSLPIELNEFHASIDKIAIKENIKGCWVKVIKTQFPKLVCIDDDDTVTGLLRFIRCCVEKEICLDMNNEELRTYFLSAFPAFPLSLYRILESSEWFKHPILSSFTTVDSIFS